MKPFLSVVVPVLNEFHQLPLAALEADRLLELADYSSEIVFVDRGYSERTEKVAKKFSEIIKNAKFLPSGEKIGEGEAVRKGILGSKGNIRLVLLPDQLSLIGKFESLINYFSPGSKENFDFVSGKRQGRFLGRFFSKIFFKKKTKDPMCSFKCFKEEAVSEIMESIRSKSFFWRFESVIIADNLGFKMKEIDIKSKPRSRFFFPARDYWEFLKESTLFIWKRFRKK